MAIRIERCGPANLPEDARLAVRDEFYLPLEKEMSEYDPGALGLAASKRMAFMDQDGQLQEVARIKDIPVSSYGTWIGSGSGQTTIFIPHGLGVIPAMVMVDPQSQDAIYAGRLSVSKNDTHIILTLQVEANTGSNNLTYAWEARL